MEEIQYIAAQFLPYHPNEITVQPIEGGLINRTFLITTGGSPARFVLQQVNDHIFPDPDAIAGNVEQVNAVLAASGYPLELCRFLKTDAGAYTMYDAAAHPWRMLAYMENSVTVHQALTPEIARQGAAAFSLFYRHLNEYGQSISLTPAIPDFINFRKRVLDYQSALAGGLPERLEKAGPLVAAVQLNIGLPKKWTDLLDAGKLPQRIIHADPKISNVLFHATHHTGLAIIDLDTVMHGTLLYDFGDMARSYCNTAAEDDAAVASPFDADLYQATKAGFLSHLADFLEPVELENLDYSAQVVVFIQCLRFLTDYLTGDTYYRVTFPEQKPGSGDESIQIVCRAGGVAVFYRRDAELFFHRRDASPQ
ncbi:MAG: aminoglycoside phosphotransferase family protein [Lewinellaceae bacterium]|nr:aminoglycoside phosphotransferase family protein [Lewinellaceae bacterium]